MKNFESPAHKDDSCQVWLKSHHAFSRRWKCKKFTDDARRTKTDGNSSWRLRWAKKKHLAFQVGWGWSHQCSTCTWCCPFKYGDCWICRSMFTNASIPHPNKVACICMQISKLCCDRVCDTDCCTFLCTPSPYNKRNARQGVEKVHSKCWINSESYDGLIMHCGALQSIGQVLYKRPTPSGVSPAVREIHISSLLEMDLSSLTPCSLTMGSSKKY